MLVAIIWPRNHSVSLTLIVYELHDLSCVLCVCVAVCVNHWWHNIVYGMPNCLFVLIPLPLLPHTNCQERDETSSALSLSLFVVWSLGKCLFIYLARVLKRTSMGISFACSSAPTPAPAHLLCPLVASTQKCVRLHQAERERKRVKSETNGRTACCVK